MRQIFIATTLFALVFIAISGTVVFNMFQNTMDAAEECLQNNTCFTETNQ